MEPSLDSLLHAKARSRELGPQVGVKCCDLDLCSPIVEVLTFWFCYFNEFPQAIPDSFLGFFVPKKSVANGEGEPRQDGLWKSLVQSYFHIDVGT